MRTPPNSLGTILLAGSIAALVCIFGGPGGCWLALRNERRRIDALEDDHEFTRKRISRREGADGREIARQNKSREEREFERIRARVEEGDDEAPVSRKKRNGGAAFPAMAIIPDWARGVVG